MNHRKSVALLLVMVKICYLEAQHYSHRNSSHSSGYWDWNNPGSSPPDQMQNHNHAHPHHHHGHSPCSEHVPKRSTMNETTDTKDIWMKLKEVFENKNSDSRMGDEKVAVTSKVARNANMTSLFSSQNCTYGICDIVKDYPAEKIASIINKSRELRQYFQENIPVQFNNRFGEDEPMCQTMMHWRFPQSAKNLRNEEMLLVNIDEKYKQAIFYETCKKEGSSCMYANIFPVGYVTTCTQKYTTRRLLAVAKTSDDAVFENFNMPSCCVCTVKKPS